MRFLSLAVGVVWLLAACDPSAMTSAAAGWGDASGFKVASGGPGGPYLADAAGRTLYTFDRDSSVSACTGSCAATWPPVLVTGAPPSSGGAAAKPVSTAERPDGTVQIAYGGALLYYYSGDRRPGDIKGNGQQGVWHLARP